MSEFDASHITVLVGLEAVRRRPGMYVGDDGHHQLIWELVGNAVDEALGGIAARIEVTIDGDRVTVEDDGRGIPVDPVATMENRSAVEIVFTTLHAGSSREARPPWPARPDRRHVHVTSDLRGAGAAVVNALSARTEVTVWRDGGTYRIDFERGVVVAPLRREGPASRTGTRVSFTPDWTLLPRKPFDLDAVRERIRLLAASYAGLVLVFQGETFVAREGLADHVRYLAGDASTLLAPPVRIVDSHEDVDVEVALTWTDRSDTQVLGLVSFGRGERGAHIDGFWAGVKRGLGTDAPLAKVRERLADGLVALVHAVLFAPKFGDPRRDRLDSPEARTAVEKVTTEGLSRWLAERPQLAAELCARLG